MNISEVSAVANKAVENDIGNIDMVAALANLLRRGVVFEVAEAVRCGCLGLATCGM
jgi:hypothetical protein